MIGSVSGVMLPPAPSKRWSSPIRSVFVPPYVGGRGWVGVYLDVPHDGAFWREITELVEDAYRMVAPRALIAQLHARGATRD
jgi:hypothetical protein